MKSPFISLSALLACCVCLLAFGLPAAGEGEEGVREVWGEWQLVLKEPLVTRTAVENGRRLAQIEAAEARQAREGGEEGQGGEDGGAEGAATPAAPARPTAADCGLELFTISGSPAPKLRWVDQNKLRIDFAPGSSPETEYRLVFKPGTTYLGGTPLATAAFSFRCKPVELYATWLQEHVGGAALLHSLWRDTCEAQELVQKHDGLRVCFRRMRHVPMVGWVCTGTVPARLRPATLADGLGGNDRVFAHLLGRMKPEDIREETLLPQCLVALPQSPLVPGARYELGVEAAAGSGFKSGNLSLGELSEGLSVQLERTLVRGEGEAPSTRLNLTFSQPVPEAQLRALWERLGVTVNGVPATRQADGSYRAESALPGQEGRAAVSLRLQGLIPCDSQLSHWRGQKIYHYAPKACSQGLTMEVQTEHPVELSLDIPADVTSRHGLGLGEAQTLSASISPVAAVLTGNGSNLLAWSGPHELMLPHVNVGEVEACAYHWSAEEAARLLPVMEHGMRDDTVFCELYQRLAWLRRRAKEGLSTSGWLGEDARTEAGRALHLLQKERRLSDPVREQALAAATAFAPQPLVVNGADNSNGLAQHGWVSLNLDHLTGGHVRPGLYLISLTYRPTADVINALRDYGMKGDEASLACTVDVLVQVTDMSLCWGRDRLLVHSLSTGQPLEGGQATLYTLPEKARGEDDEARQLSALQEAVPLEGQPPLLVRQGELVMPPEAGGRLLLLQRGEDYALLSLWNETVRAASTPSLPKPMLELFCERPLYRPGDVAHLRAVLRRPVKGGVALPRAGRGTLVVLKPNGDVMETREVMFDAFGALVADVSLPAGEEDVTGSYRCLLTVEEGGAKVEGELVLRCEVFRRDAFQASLRIEMDPVAPKQYKVVVKATDYNGTPLVGGKVRLELGSTAPLRDEAGQRPSGLKEELGRNGVDFCEWTQELVLDAEGCAHVSGCLGAYDEEKSLQVSGSVANEREEYVQMPGVERRFSPADFMMVVDDGARLHLRDARSEEPQALSRAQEVELCILKEEEERRELPSGIYYTEAQQRELARHRITVPANCTQGVELSPYLPEQEGNAVTLRLSACDSEGRRLVKEHEMFSWRRASSGKDTLRAEGGHLRFECAEAFRTSGKQHAYISSQGQRRHALVAVEAGEQAVDIPLTPSEYGEVRVTLIGCEKDDWGSCTKWSEREARCELPRPDKTLRVELHLPDGAKPGEKVMLQGRVHGADGQAVKAAVTLFAVDAGMMSVAPYTLPELATRFYRGVAERFALEGDTERPPCEPSWMVLPNVWSMQGASWYAQQSNARRRSVTPPGVNVGSWRDGTLGAVYRWGLREAVRGAQPSFRWSQLLDVGQQMPCEAVPAPAPVMEQKAAYGDVYRGKKAAKKPNSLMSGGLRRGSGGLSGDSRDSQEEAEVPEPRLRTHFEPVALWLASLETAEDGSFCAVCTLPDTLTTYTTYAVALDASGSSFGQAKGEFLVNQQLMLTPGTPFFMSTGDKLLLPLTLTNNQDESGQWVVTLEGAGNTEPQHVTLEARGTTTLYFDVEARDEGDCTLRWSARSQSSADAVQGVFPVRYPAPLLKEAHRLVLAEGAEAVSTAGLLAGDVGEATRGEVHITYATSPLIHLAGSVDFLLHYPYGCTEQRASAMLPWIYYEHLAPFCPHMARTAPEQAKATLERSIHQLLARQQEDGGLCYWAAPKGEPRESSPWASAYAGLVLTLAKEQGAEVPEDALERLRNYLGRQNWRKSGYQTQYAVARTRGRSGEVNRILVRALRQELKEAETYGFGRDTADLEFMAGLQSNPGGRHEALLSWLRSKGKDYRHRTSWRGGWTLIALAEYLRLEPKASGGGSIVVNGEELAAESKPGRVSLSVGAGQQLRDVAPTLAAAKGTVYANVYVKAQPEQTDYPGETEHGLQVTRVYEVQDASGQWRETTNVKTGELVRVTLTCAKIADELEYFVLEDYLPSCMEAVNPNVPSQAVGLENGGRGVWSPCFDHKEYLADRVRGFCTRWSGRDVVNMSYYARVKRAGTCTAPPAAAQLMYEPQTYGLSPNVRVQSQHK